MTVEQVCVWVFCALLVPLDPCFSSMDCCLSPALPGCLWLGKGMCSSPARSLMSTMSPTLETSLVACSVLMSLPGRASCWGRDLLREWWAQGSGMLQGWRLGGSQRHGRGRDGAPVITICLPGTPASASGTPSICVGQMSTVQRQRPRLWRRV